MIRARTFVAAVALTLAHVMAWGQDCKGFKWDVSRERALFAGKALAITAGAQSTKAPSVQPGKLYEVTLTPQEQVRFAAEPGKKMISDGASAGLLRVRVVKAGTYRVAVSQAFWIDLVNGGNAIPSLDFSGSHDCERPRKIVVYELPADRDLTLQLSGQVDTHVLLSITPVSGKS